MFQYRLLTTSFDVSSIVPVFVAPATPVLPQHPRRNLYLAVFAGVVICWDYLIYYDK